MFKRIYKIKNLKKKEIEIYKNNILIDWIRYKRFLSHYERKEFEKKWRYLKKKYSKIFVHMFVADAIGEMIVRFLNMKEDMKSYQIRNEYHIFLPSFEGKEIGNYKLVNVLRRYIPIITIENFKFWEYVLINHFDEIRIEKYLQYKKRRQNAYLCQKPIISLLTEENEEASEKLSELGIDGEFVCIHCRDAQYNQRVYEKEYDYYNFRNADISCYTEFVKYLYSQGVQAVRMGKYSEKSVNIENCIDYGYSHYDELLDLYLSSKCKFFVGTSSGLACLPPLFGKNVALVNVTNIACGYGAMPWHKKDLFIPKKMWNTRQGRFLTLAEWLEMERQCTMFGDRYAAKGIKFIENTQAEIKDLVVELNERINGNWIEIEEDELLQKQFRKILDEWSDKTKFDQRSWIGSRIPIRIGTKFLHDNQYFLE